MYIIYLEHKIANILRDPWSKDIPLSEDTCKNSEPFFIFLNRINVRGFLVETAENFKTGCLLRSTSHSKYSEHLLGKTTVSLKRAPEGASLLFTFSFGSLTFYFRVGSRDFAET